MHWLKLLPIYLTTLRHKTTVERSQTQETLPENTMATDREWAIPLHRARPAILSLVFVSH